MQKYLSILILYIFFSCNPEKKETPDTSQNKETINENQVSLSDKQFNALDIELGGIDNRAMHGEIKCNGIVDVPPQNMVSVSAPMGGFIKNINLLIGDKVKKGQVLAWLEHPDYIQLQEDYLKALGQEKYFSQDLSRQEELNNENVGAKKNLQQSQAQAQSARATKLALEAKLEMIGLPIEKIQTGKIYKKIPLLSPIDGFVKIVNINAGKFVSPADVILEIINTEILHIELQVFEKDFYKIEGGQKVIFKVNNQPTEMQAIVHLTGKTFDEADKTVNIHCDVSGKYPQLLPGMYVNARVITGNKLSSCLPDEAIIMEGDLNYIFILESHGEGKYNFKKLLIKPGLENEGFTEVGLSENLKKNEKIVKKGAYFINSTLKNTGEEE